jgi:hypothetical protein
VGSKAPVGETVLTAGRRGMIAVDARGRQKGFSGGESRPAVMVGCSRPLRARDPRFFDAFSGALAAADAQGVGRSYRDPAILMSVAVSLQ